MKIFLLSFLFHIMMTVTAMLKMAFEKALRGF